MDTEKIGIFKNLKNISTLLKLFPETTIQEAMSRLSANTLLPGLLSFTCEDSHVNAWPAQQSPVTTIQQPTNAGVKLQSLSQPSVRHFDPTRSKSLLTEQTNLELHSIKQKNYKILMCCLSCIPKLSERDGSETTSQSHAA